MGYRDERDGLRVRVEELESELAASKAREVALQGDDERDVLPEPKVGLLGVPLRLRMRREVPFKVSQEGLDEIAKLLRCRLPKASLHQRPTGVVQTLSTHEVSVQHTEEGTTINLSTLLRNGIREAMVAWVVMSTLSITMAGQSILPSAFTMLALPVVVVGSLFVAGAFMRWYAKRHRRELMALFAAVADVAEQYRVLAPQRIAQQGLRLVTEDDEQRLLEEQQLLEEQAVAEA